MASTAAALAAVLEALERIAEGGCCSEDGGCDHFECPVHRARAALATWKTREPLRADETVVDAVEDWDSEATTDVNRHRATLAADAIDSHLFGGKT
jgi:hypothetical protein